MDSRKLKEKATEAFTKGKFAKAAEAYEEYCAADPRDLQARLRMGDAWVKAGKKEKAIGAYQFAAEGFAKEGFLPRAIAASKLILELDPAHKGVQKMLAELYARKTGPGSGAPRPKTAATLGMKADKHAPIELPKEEDAPPLPPPQEPAAKKNSEHEEPPIDGIPIDIEESLKGKKKPAPPAPEIELDVSVTGSGVAVLPEVKAKEPVPAPDVEVLPLPDPEAPITASGSFEIDVGDAKSDGAKTDAIVEIPGVTRTTSGAYELDLDEPMPEAPFAEIPGVKRTTSGAYELELDEPITEATAPVAVTEAAKPAEPAKDGEHSGLERVPSGAYELDLDDAPPDESLPVELTRPKSPGINEARLMAELQAEPSEHSKGSSPPGLRPKPLEPEPPPPPAVASKPAEASKPPRIWLPNNVTPPPAEGSQKFIMPTRGGGPKTDLERSLEAFSKFEDEVQIFDGAVPSPPKPSAPRAHLFTELELEGDSLLHAVEAAAVIGLEQRGQEVVPAPVEEKMEPLDDAKPEPGALPKIPLFSDLPEDAFIELFERCPLRRLEPTNLVIQQGTLGDSFFVICAGTVKVFRTDGEVRRDIATLHEGAFFGEMALLSGAARTASVEAASEDTQLLEISAPILTELSHKYPTVATALKKFCRQRLLTNVMSSSALFAPFSRTERRALVERFRARDVNKGDVLIKQGQRSDGMYIVLSGEIEVKVGSVKVAELNEGDVFGEMSLLTKAPAAATCLAARRTSLLRLPREEFDQIVLSHPQILVLVSELTDERKRQNAALASRAPKAGVEATPMV